MSVRFPGETAEYRAARDQLLEAEIALRRQTEAVAAMRRTLPPGGAVADDYRFAQESGEVRLSELFATHDTLVLYSFMFPRALDVNVFTRHDGEIRHFWSSELLYVPSEAGQDPRHVDLIWPVWSVLDTTPEGRGTDWSPRLEYPVRACFANDCIP